MSEGPQVYEQKTLGVRLTVWPLTQRLYMAFSEAHREYQHGENPTPIQQRDTFVKAALACNWIDLEALATGVSLAPADLDSAPPAVVNWIANGRGPKSLFALYLEASEPPKG